MAEFLVRASAHWMDSLKQADVNKMTPGQKQSYNARTQIGDIIVVRPDGWTWGNEEKLPNFIVVKLPQISYDTVKKYEEALMDTTSPDKPVILKRRKYRIPESWVTANKQDVVTITLTAQQTTLINNIITKVS